MHDVRHTLSAIEQLDLSYLEDRYDRPSEQGLAPFDEAVAEFKRFLILVATQDKPLAVTNKSVDHLWHTFLIHSKSYADFCEEAFGEFIHHQPHSMRFPVPLSAISDVFAAYEKAFGDIPDSWFDGVHLTRDNVSKGQLPEALAFQWSGWTGR